MSIVIVQPAVRIRSLAIALLAAGFAAVAAAEAVHYDVFVTSTGSGPGAALVVGGASEDDGTAFVPAGQLRVFGGEVVGTGATPYETEGDGEPGFRAYSQTFLNGANMDPPGVYTALAPGTPLTFDFQSITIGATRNLFFWNGEGPVSFGTVGADVVLTLSDGWTRSIDGASSGIVSGDTIQTTTSGGGVHTHLTTSIAKAGGAPDQGFYLFALRLAMAGYASSEPLYFVFGALDPLAMDAEQFEAFEAAHDTAIDWVGANLVPEPSALPLLGLAAAAAIPLVWRRCRAAA